MQIGVISDTHLHAGRIELPGEVLKALSTVDLIIHCGDFCVYEVFEYLQQIGKGKVVGVCGNMDSPEVRRKLPERDILEVEGHKIGVIHGSGAPEGIERRMLDAFADIEGIDLIIYGHTHEAADFIRDGIHFFNPGSPTDKRFARYNSYGILDIGNRIESTIIHL